MTNATQPWRIPANVLQAAVAAALLMPIWWGHAPVAASAAATAAQAEAALQAAPDVQLRLNYRTMNIGSDGVQREASYTKIMYREGQRIWIEKDQPQALRDSLAHGHGGTTNTGPHAGHAHTLAQEAPIMVQRSDTGEVEVQVIIKEMEQLISVEPAHQGNVGYNGSWEATYWVIPPSSLTALQPVGQPRDGIQLYRKFADESMTEVAWDIEKQYPRRVLKRGPHDTTFYQLTAEEIDAPEVMPWTLLSHYKTGDYSDLLD
ncbi:hypothetical protein E8K88_09840 [Lampropedia aestuarii]|uniref:Uncharacterized protein n=1 Tax=Lampropedia aestuarii TaxID=2562762 RepID=A0A4S5BLS5_9BURK|nr:hypothetical protein [Lampropedia aestuarii]MDH5858654.1 hypothetical protein [Lampropedia aestuarii]THJ33219.1 hypothetical protein E8K88_09840 [Lampropedia aestuarii]